MKGHSRGRSLEAETLRKSDQELKFTLDSGLLSKVCTARGSNAGLNLTGYLAHKKMDKQSIN